MTETPTDATVTTGLGQSANGAAPAPGPLADVAEAVGTSERVMFAIMLIAGAGLLFLAIDGLSGYALTRAMFGQAPDGNEG